MSATSDSPSEIPPVERLIDLALFGPLTLGARVVDLVPCAVDRTRRELTLARVVGKLAVDQGTREIRRRLRTADDGAEDVAGAAATPTGPRSHVTADTVPGSRLDSAGTPGDDDVDTGAGAVPAEVPAVADLALPDYDHLPAAHVVGKLSGLAQDERDVIERYERAHRHRRTVLGKLDQLRVAST